MKGIDVTDREIEAAKSLIRNANPEAADGDPEGLITIKRGDLVRLVAWYGAVRSSNREVGVIVNLGAPAQEEIP